MYVFEIFGRFICPICPYSASLGGGEGHTIRKIILLNSEFCKAIFSITVSCALQTIVVIKHEVEEKRPLVGKMQSQLTMIHCLKYYLESFGWEDLS